MTQVLLKTRGLICGYQHHDPLFRPLDLELKTGEITAILGGNGRGKTTLMRTLTGQLRALSGTVQCSAHIGFVPQRFQASYAYRVLDIVLMGRANRLRMFSVPGAKDEQIAYRALRQLSIEHLALCAFDQLSGGQQQLVLIARALSSECQIMILDELATALDLAHQSIVLTLLKQLADRQHLSILFSTHEPAHAKLIAHHSLLLLAQRQHLYGPSAQVLTEDVLSNLYGVPIQRGTYDYGGQCYSTFIPWLVEP
ncbi:ABC transporter ATP-binding protein [Celerinatantimonas sp. YJH-8]|uniref:ABC transporter ATP-binding protein n=1 Tax=Celerinatantimonas sp. YJH-8 TaxID=3228714 RepID=UPI0038C26CF7